MRDDGDGPRNSIELVILKASTHIAKIYYEQKYVEGSNAAPDCYSTNGITPDPGAQKKQATNCASCPQNAWGSRVTPEGKQAKACSDSKRLAVVPLNDILNEVFGGPMLLRVPAASLGELASFGQKMAHLGYPYNAIGIKVSFDPAAAFPKFQFEPIRALTEDEAQKVMKLLDGPEVDRILAETEFQTEAPQQLAAPQGTPQVAHQVQAPVQHSTTQPAQQPVSNEATVVNTAFGAVAPAQPAPVPASAPAPSNGSGGGSGFGPTEPTKPKVAPAAEPVDSQGAPASDFTAALDAKLGKLLPE